MEMQTLSSDGGSVTCASCQMTVGQAQGTRRTICPFCGSFYNPAHASLSQRRRDRPKPQEDPKYVQVVCSVYFTAKSSKTNPDVDLCVIVRRHINLVCVSWQINPHLDHEMIVHILLVDTAYVLHFGCYHFGHFFKKRPSMAKPPQITQTDPCLSQQIHSDFTPIQGLHGAWSLDCSPGLTTRLKPLLGLIAC